MYGIFWHRLSIKVQGSMKMEILKGLPVAQAINEELIKESQEAGIKPHLAIIRVGERPDDCSYAHHMYFLRI